MRDLSEEIAVIGLIAIALTAIMVDAEIGKAIALTISGGIVGYLRGSKKEP